MNSTVTYKCPNCGAGLIFDAESQNFICEFCISSFTEPELEKTDAAERAARAEAEDKEFSEQVNAYTCESCGAQIIAEKNTVADFCYYCHNPIVLSGEIAGVHKPSKLIPFKFDKEEAKNIFLRYVKKKRFLPGDYFAPEQADKILGVYYPFWVVDADTNAGLNATGKKVRTWRSGNYRYTETSIFNIQRAGDIHFEDISASAISNEDKEMLEGILPYPSNEHIDFSIPYLQGYIAKKRDIDREALAEEVKGRMNSYAETLLRGTVNGGYSSLETNNLALGMRSCNWQYTLFPIWILNYQRKGKNYTYAMNGSTGKIYGRLPISIPKLSILFGAVGILTWLITFLIGGLL